MSRIGRPPQADLSDPEVVDEICARIISGEGINAICKLDHMPSKSAFYERLAGDEGFRTRITHAREAQQEALIDETVEMADEATPADWQVVKLRIWARQWRAAKLAPKRYGDSVQLKHADHEGKAIDLAETGAAAKMAALLEAVRLRALGTQAQLEDGSTAGQASEPQD